MLNQIVEESLKGAAIWDEVKDRLHEGQYDTYSNMQLAQYVSTIANGGNRMEPHIVKEIREPLMDNGGSW